MASLGIDRSTGKVLTDFSHVIQSIEVIFSTRIGERVMRRHFGSASPALIGRAMTPNQVFVFFYLIMWTLERWEPRFKVVQIVPSASAEEARLGHMNFVIEGEYRPFAHLGDFRPEGVLRKISVDARSNAFSVRSL